MAAALNDAATFASDETVLPAVTAALVANAIQVMDEDPQTPNHPLRTSLSVAILNNPTDQAKRFVWAVATDADVVQAWVNGDKDQAVDGFDAVIEAVWNPMAGVTQYA